MIRTIKIDIPTIQEIKDLRHPIGAFLLSEYLKLDLWAFKRFNKIFWKLMYRLTGRCGSLLKGHTPVFGNTKSWLWISNNGNTCSICGHKIEASKGYVNYKNYARKGRQADMEQLIAMRKTATNESEKISIDKAMYNINHEEKHVKDMREDLIKATREHDHDNIREVHEYVGENQKYRREVV